jgi:hypothetical protein
MIKKHRVPLKIKKRELHLLTGKNKINSLMKRMRKRVDLYSRNKMLASRCPR